MRRQSRMAGLLMLGLAGISSGCAARVYTPTGTTTLSSGVAVRYVDYVPPNLYAYPSVMYDGRPAYLYNDHWYYNSPRGWAILQTEPAPLRSYRHTIRQRGYVQQAPPAYPRYPTQSAPPATRVR